MIPHITLDSGCESVLQFLIKQGTNWITNNKDEWNKLRTACTTWANSPITDEDGSPSFQRWRAANPVLLNETVYFTLMRNFGSMHVVECSMDLEKAMEKSNLYRRNWGLFSYSNNTWKYHHHTGGEIKEYEEFLARPLVNNFLKVGTPNLILEHYWGSTLEVADNEPVTSADFFAGKPKVKAIWNSTKQEYEVELPAHRCTDARMNDWKRMAEDLSAFKKIQLINQRASGKTEASK